ncbi:MAG: hypothetical protein P1V97_25270 [Planctomycetota bacterium]|nr:hypothetical protein [Planctomycetota bacterium]
MRVIIDIDQTITQAPNFFSWLTHALRRDQHWVGIVTVRCDRESSLMTLKELDISFNILETLPLDEERDCMDWKLDTIHGLEADVVFDDWPELSHKLDPKIFVALPRDTEMGNLVYDDNDMLI